MVMVRVPCVGPYNIMKLSLITQSYKIVSTIAYKLHDILHNNHKRYAIIQYKNSYEHKHIPMTTHTDHTSSQIIYVVNKRRDPADSELQFEHSAAQRCNVPVTYSTVQYYLTVS